MTIKKLDGEPDLPSSYARDIPYYTLKEMKRSVKRCHKLYGKTMMMNDLMYMLQIIDFGELQKLYRGEEFKCGFG